MTPDYDLSIFVDVALSSPPGSDATLPADMRMPVVIDAGCANGRCWWRCRTRTRQSATGNSEFTVTETELEDVSDPLGRLLGFLGVA